jgi:hypothetical protein
MKDANRPLPAMTARAVAASQIAAYRPPRGIAGGATVFSTAIAACAALRAKLLARNEPEYSVTFSFAGCVVPVPPRPRLSRQGSLCADE